MTRRFGAYPLALIVLACLLLLVAWLSYYAYLMPPPLRAASDAFLVEPYLQLGPQGDPERPLLVWATRESGEVWGVSLKQVGSRGASSVAGTAGTSFAAGTAGTSSAAGTAGTSSAAGTAGTSSAASASSAIALTKVPVNIAGLPQFTIFAAQLSRIPPRTTWEYAVTKGGATVFHANLAAPKSADEELRVDIAGDIANGSPSERAIAKQIFASSPDLVVVPGDIVYKYGRTLEYLDHFFPVYNADAGSAAGVPLLRSTLMVAAPGNHDTAVGARNDTRNLDTFPDGMGYFLWWKQPLNGPDVAAHHSDMPVPWGAPERRQAFVNASASDYPREENFSFNIGNTHWTVLDGNIYMDWTHDYLRDWLEKDLQSAANSKWKFVVFHQTCFSSDPHHFEEQRMRLICDILQRQNVDVVFAGHVHNYQRTYPLKFSVIHQPDATLISADGTVSGEYIFDKQYDGKKATKPNAPIYITTGGGGAPVSGADIATKPDSWQPFTYKFIAKHGFTQCIIKGGHMQVRQIDETGNLLDEFAVDK